MSDLSETKDVDVRYTVSVEGNAILRLSMDEFKKSGLSWDEYQEKSAEDMLSRSIDYLVMNTEISGCSEQLTIDGIDKRDSEVSYIGEVISQ